jgi:hypothetical protein
MHTRMMSLVAVPFVAAALSFAGAVPASAQGPVNVSINPTVGNLIAVDLNIQDVQIIDDVIVGAVVQAPIGIAANVCPVVNAAVLAQDVRQDGEAECEAETTTRAFSRLVQRQLDL